MTAAIVGLMAATPGIVAQLTPTWTDNADSESGFRVERRLQIRCPQWALGRHATLRVAAGAPR
jgi:hypothetical protein